MTEKDIKANLNKKVEYNNPIYGRRCGYILTGAIIRKGENGYFYQAELTEEKTGSIIYAKLEDIEAIERC